MLKKILIIFLLMTTFVLADEEADKAEFKKLYAEFNDLYSNSEAIDPIIEVAEKLIEIAPKAYGKNHMNTAVVTYNLASLYLEKGDQLSFSDYDNKAADLFENYFHILNEIDAPKDKNYVNQYLYYLKSITLEVNQKQAVSRAKRIHSIIEELDYTTNERALLEFSLGLLLFKNQTYKQSIRYFENAHEYYLEALGPDHVKIGEVLFWLAKLDLGKNKRKSAEKKFVKALAIFQKNPETSFELAQNTHAFLVQLYEDIGDSDKATLHCQAVAEERPKDFDQHIKPLYRKSVEFPELESYEFAKIKQTPAEVLLEFDVDKNGFTRNIKVLESSNKKFNKASLEATEGYRYAPAIVNGELSVTKGARLRIVFGISK